MTRSNFIKRMFLLIIIISVFLSYKYFSSSNIYFTYFNSFIQKSSTKPFIESVCSCRKEEKIDLTFDPETTNYRVQSSLTNKEEYYLSKDELQNIKCDIHSALRRGKNTKVIGFSLYGKKKLYYNLLPGLIKLVRKYYSGWIIRIYHDSSILNDIKCELECLKDDEQNIFDNIDFCDVEKLPIVNSKNNISNNLWNDSNIKNNSWNANYTHSMIWRWFPIGDHLVEAFMSRDSDSLITQREIDSVNVWFNSGKYGHIMRDHPQHCTQILGGMWGFYNSRNRRMADDIFAKLKNHQIMNKYKKKDAKGHDQFFLTDEVYPMIKAHSIIHDSFCCKIYKDSKPFPNQRIGDCFIAMIVGINHDCRNRTFHKCPLECRPSDHQDWTTC